MRENKNGFTLVELLVVVSIIAILSVIGLTLFSGAQQNARDARRKSDVDAIAAALETKRQPAAVYYLPLVGTDFSSGGVPVDTNTTVTQAYCIRLYPGIDTAKNETNPTNAWAGAGCPADAAVTTAGSEATVWYPATIAGGFQAISGTAAVPFSATASSWGANKKSWKICARLENTSATPNVYCKGSAQ